MSKFKIVLNDGHLLTEDDTAPRIFGAASLERLESYTHEDEWLNLRFTGGHKVRIPESNVAYIAIAPASN